MKFNFCILGITFYLITFTNAVPVNRISPQNVAGVVIAGNPPSNPAISNHATSNPAPANYVHTNYVPQNHVNPAQSPESYYVYPATIAPPPTSGQTAQTAQPGKDVLAYLSNTLSQSSPQALGYVSKAMPASIDLPKIGDE